MAIYSVPPQLQEVRSTLNLVTHTVRLLTSPGLDGHALSITNTVDIRKESNKASHTHSIPLRAEPSMQCDSLFNVDAQCLF